MKQSKVMCLFCFSCFRSFFSFPLFFFFLIYVCSHYIPYYFFLTLLSLYLIWLHCDIKLFKCISLNIWPLATCLVSIFFFCSALSISNSLLLLYLFVVLPSSSIFSGFLPFFYFSFVHGVLNTLLSLLHCVFSLSDSHLHPYPHLSFPLLNPQPAYMCNTWGIWILFLWLTIHPKENNFQLSTALNWYPY